MAAGLQYSTGKNKTLQVEQEREQSCWVVQAYPEGAQDMSGGLSEPLLAHTLASLRSTALDCWGM